MSEISEVVNSVRNIAGRYGLKILHLDITDVTFISRVGLSHEVFVQIYANTIEEKLNMALVVSGERIFGMDKEGGYYHTHPFENPLLHVETNPMGIEDFVIESLGILKKLNLF